MASKLAIVCLVAATLFSAGLAEDAGESSGRVLAGSRWRTFVPTTTVNKAFISQINSLNNNQIAIGGSNTAAISQNNVAIVSQTGGRKLSTTRARTFAPITTFNKAVIPQLNSLNNKQFVFGGQNLLLADQTNAVVVGQAGAVGRKLRAGRPVNLSNVGSPDINVNVATNVAPQIAVSNQIAFGGSNTGSITQTALSSFFQRSGTAGRTGLSRTRGK